MCGITRTLRNTSIILLGMMVNLSAGDGQTIRTYTEMPMTVKILNPERGHVVSGSIVPPWRPLSVSSLTSERNVDSLTVHYAVFDLSNYRDGRAISESDLNVLKQSFWAAHQAGVKLILRFTYCSSNCSGFTEAPIDSCVKHIAQVMKIVRDSVALLAFVNAGWVGAWGEWGNGYSPVRRWDTLVAPRQRIMDTTLAYLPGTRQYSVGQLYHLGNAVFTRYGLEGFQWDWRTLAGDPAPDTLTYDQAWDSTYKRARVGFNMDGYLLNAADGYNNDGGQYYVYPRCGHEPPCPTGTWDGTYPDARYGLPWWSRNSRFFTVYGEVCGGAGDLLDFRCSTTTPQNWLEHGRTFHPTYFPFSSGRCAFNWKNAIAECWDTTFNKLGYRISILNDTIPESVMQGDTLTFRVTLRNRGWATPTNPRNVYAVLRRSDGGYVRYNAVQSWDWRNPLIPNAVFGQPTESPAEHTFTFRAYIDPALLPAGAYTVGIWAPDYYPSLHDDSRYSIRFANTPAGGYSWEDSTGINNLGVTVSVTDLYYCPSDSLDIAPGTLAFGEDVEISCGVTSTMTVTTRAGCEPPTVTAMSDNHHFTVLPASMLVGPGGADFSVTFTPTDTVLETGTITLSSSGGGPPIGVPVSGRGAGIAAAMEVPVGYYAGWGILSLPVKVVCPYITTGLYAFDGDYIPSDTMRTGRGYWRKHSLPTDITYVGYSIDRDTISVVRGWNLIGSISNPVPTAVIEDDSIIGSQYFTYQNGYKHSDTIQPGHGYWVDCLRDGEIILDATLAPRKGAPPNDILSGMNRLVVTDVNGRTQTLFFGISTEQGHRENYLLPPLPPEGNFDVRYASGRLLETVSGAGERNAPVRISSAAYPVTLRWEIVQESLSASLKVGRTVTELKGSDALVVVDRAETIALLMKIR